MRSTLLLCGAIMLSATIDTSAQQFVNGGFEPNKATTACTDLPVATYNSNMDGNNATGTAPTMQLGNSSCSQGNPVSGGYYAIMKYAPPYGNILTFKLDKPMTIGTTYRISLSYKAATGIQAAMNALRYGYASDSTTSDSLSGYTDPITSTTWMKDTLSITPQKAWQYVWLEVTALGGEEFTLHVDRLDMLDMPSNVDEIASNPVNIQIAPNPARGLTTINMSNNISLPCKVQVYDMTGRMVLQKENINNTTTGIDLAGIASGIYILKLTDNTQQTHATRLMVR